MNSANIKLSKRFPYFYVIEPAVSDTVQIITGTTFYLTAVSTSSVDSLGPSGIPTFDLIILQNLSLEKYTAVGETVFPEVGGNLGSPYFLNAPWKLEGGTLLRAIVTSSLSTQIMLGGYNES
jgi:hypothetical protein